MSSVETKPVSFLDFLVQIEQLDGDTLNELAIRSLSLDEQTQKLIEIGPFSQEHVAELFSLWENTPQINIGKISLDAFKLPEKLARDYAAVILEENETAVKIAIKNPHDHKAVHLIRMRFDKPVDILLAPADVIQRTLEKLYRQTHKATIYAKDAIDLADSHKIYQLKPFDIIKDASGSSVSGLLDAILEDALNLETSDIHIEADSHEVIVRYRLSGSLIKQMRFGVELKQILMRHVIARSGGDISEMRLPQDTSFQYTYKGEVISIRASAIFSLTGYSIVLRLLMPAGSYFDLKATIDAPETYEVLKEMLDAGNGMLIVTGPTSSGKTTLLYNALMYVAQQSRKILTAEDPVEVELPGITQVQVRPEIGLDYDEVIKTALRQNPDALMLGEIRDGDTASMAMRAAITGIMVAATLHTKNVTSTVLRLTDLGVGLPLVATGVKLIVAARLCRRLCTNCRSIHELTQSEMQKLEKSVSPEEIKKYKYYKANGCEDCLDTGYRGLHGVYECLRFDTPIVMSLAQGDFDEFRKAAFAQIKGKTLGDNVISLWQQGITSYEEVTKLVFNT